MVSPLHKRRAVHAVVTAGLCSQRRACLYLGLHRSSGRYQNKGPSDWLLRLSQHLEALSRKYSRECLALHVARKLTAHDLVEVMERLVTERGAPEHIRSDNGSEFIARVLQQWLAQRCIKTLYIEPGSPWQNGHVESFNGSLRDECLDRELMLSVAEARVLIEDYRRHYNEERPHGGIGYRTPAQVRLEALGSSRPPGSLRQELDPSPTTSILQT